MDYNSKTRLYNVLMGNPSANNAIGRTAGLSAGQQQGGGDNFFVKRGKSIENAVGTTGAALKESGFDLLGADIATLTSGDYVSNESRKQNEKTEALRQDNRSKMNEIAKEYGFNTYQDVWDARDRAKASGDKNTLDLIDNTINPRLQAQANAGNEAMKANADEYKDYRENNYVSQKINQDPGKFAGSAINTMSTALDVTGLTTNPLANAVQGGVEGLADELEQNGFENFDLNRAGQNALIGATTGAVTGALNKGISSSLAKRAAAKGLANTAEAGLGQTIKQGAKTIAGGAARGALSGAVGGATGAGLSAAMNEQDVLGSALKGAVQGAQQGAITGGVMAGVNMAPGIKQMNQKFAEAQQNWQNSGDTFGERWANTRAKDTWGNRLINGTEALPGKVADLVKERGVGLGIKDVSQDTPEDIQNMWLRDYNADTDGQNTNKPYEYIGANGQKALKIEMPILNDVSAEESSAFIKQAVKDLAQDGRLLNVGDISELANVSSNSAKKAGDGAGWNDAQLKQRNEVIADIEEVGGYLHNVRYEAPKANAKDNVIGVIKGDVEVDINGKKIYPEVVYRLYDNGDVVLHDVTKINRLPSGNSSDQNLGRYVKTPEAAKQPGDDSIVTQNNRIVNTTDPWDRLAQESGYKDYDSVVKAFQAANPGVKVGENDAGMITTWLDQHPGNWNPNMSNSTMADNLEAPEESVYGKSNFGSNKKTLREKLGLALERSQVNATRKETRDIGIKDAGELVDRVRQRTGLTDLNEQAQFAQEITGGKNSLLDTIQNEAMSTNADGSTRVVDLTSLDPEIRRIVDDAPDTLIGFNQKQEILAGIQRELTNHGVTAVQKANDMRASASELYTKNAKTPNKSDVAEGNIYSQVAELIEDKVYSEIPKENVDWMYDTAISEAKGRAQQLAADGNKDGAKAYNNLADDIANTDRTIKNYRSFKKDFVDINKLATKTSQGNTAWNNNGLTVGTAVTAAALSGGNPLITIPAAAGAKLLAPAVGEATTKGAAKLGGKLVDWGRGTAKSTASNTVVNPSVTSPAEIANITADYNPATQIYNAIGRTEGLNNAEQARTANYLVDAVQGQNAASSGLNNPTVPDTNASMALYNSIYGTPTTTTQAVNSGIDTGYFQPTGDYWTDILAGATSNAIDMNDMAAFGSLYSMYQDSLANVQKQASSTSSNQQKLSATQQRANAAMNSLERLSQMTPDMAYNLSGIPLVGGIATFGGNDYEAEAKSLAQQIGYMVSGSNIKDSEAENIGKSYVPQPWDNEQVRQNKLRRAREIIQQYQSGYIEA